MQVVHNNCTASGKTKRQYIKDLLADLSQDNKEIKNSIFGAIKRSGLDGWHEKRRSKCSESETKEKPGGLLLSSPQS
jgi:hypothetical protein